ncbi:MAG: copper-binding protein [Deltaproteobacteria bacterium]|nr:copper-binding protein [Deltaproteobacteria bacterium]MBW2396273.1 copper-binding protein [Deltaproteobacteria bacterium]
MPKRSVLLLLALTVFISALACAPETGASGDHFPGAGTVNSIAADERKINITHDPIPALGWPEMTMDFQLADAVTLEGIEPGQKVEFRLRKRADGAYVIESFDLAKD